MPSTSPFCFAIAASFTSEPLEGTIEFWGGPLQAEFTCRFAPFGQLLQTILDPGSIFAMNRHGLNVVLVRWCDLGEPERRQQNAEALIQAIEARASAFGVPLLVVPDFEWSSVGGAYVLTEDRINAWYPVEAKISEEGERLGGIPFTADYFVALGTSIVRSAQAIQMAPYKVMALDCDHTLWQGICGEDGADGVKLLGGHVALQRFALAQREAGMLLVLCSKNNEEDVVETFAAHEEFPLGLKDITAQRVNWLPKSSGLAELAEELSLGLDSFVFLDDNVKEISEVDEQLPQVLGLALPQEPALFERFLGNTWAFDRMNVTSEDAVRAASYQGVQEFGKVLHKAGSLEHFHATLELSVVIRAVSEAEMTRAGQLTQRTNQFNFMTIRRTEAELRGLRTSGVELFGIHVSDRFGNYGFTGLLMGRVWGAEYLVDNFLLSCRVLGRGVEHRVFAWLGEHAAQLGCREVEIAFEQTVKNAAAKEFVSDLRQRLSVADLAAYCFEPKRAEAAVAVQTGKTAVQHRPDYAHIAASLYSVATIRAAMRADRVFELETATENRLAGIWQDLLDAELLQGESNFFDLGGHSLKVVLLLMRVKEEFAVSLGIEDVYAAEVTLERMARRIDELVAFGGVGHAEYTRLLGAIEAMSEEEAEAVWLEESQANADSVSR